MIYKSANREYFGDLVRSHYPTANLVKKGDARALQLKLWVEDVNGDSRVRSAVARSLIRSALGLTLLVVDAEDSRVVRHNSITITNDKSKGYSLGALNVPSNNGDINSPDNLQIHFTGGQGLQAVRQSLGKVAVYLDKGGYSDTASFITAVTYPRMSRMTRRFGFQPVPLIEINTETYEDIVTAERVFNLLNNRAPDHNDPEATYIPTREFIELHRQ